jgi:hypothetical protein
LCCGGLLRLICGRGRWRLGLRAVGLLPRVQLSGNTTGHSRKRERKHDPDSSTHDFRSRDQPAESGRCPFSEATDTKLNAGLTHYKRAPV